MYCEDTWFKSWLRYPIILTEIFRGTRQSSQESVLKGAVPCQALVWCVVSVKDESELNLIIGMTINISVGVKRVTV
jgi:hypothetical protein